MLVCPSSVDLSNRTLRFLTGRLRARRQEIGTRRWRLPASRQALLVLAHIRCGDTYAQLAPGSASGSRLSTATYVRPSRPWSPLAPSLAETMRTIRTKAFVILDGTLLPIDRIAADTPYYSGKHKRHGHARCVAAGRSYDGTRAPGDAPWEHFLPPGRHLRANASLFRKERQ